MISSVLSRSDINAKRALFISTDKVAVYHWTEGDLGRSYLFDTDAEGRQNYIRYLQRTANIPFYVIVDVFEEEYRQDTIPHVFGPDRASIIKRKISRLFRDTPYYFHRVIGREKEGRRDDKVLLTAITNPEIVKPWIDMLTQEKVPLVGIYSLALFSETIVKSIQEESSKHKLIVSIQSMSGLRQTYFNDNEFRISRLVQMPRYGSTPYAPYIQNEIEKIRRYLSSLRLITADESLEIYFLLSGDLLQELKKEYADEQDTTQFIFCDVNALLKKAGSKKRLTTPFSEQYFVHQMLKTKPVNFYASKKEKRYFSMRRMRYSMIAASVLLLFASVIWSGINFASGLSYKQNSLAARQKIQFYTRLHDLARQRLPKIPVAPVELKVAIDLAQTMKAHKTSPLELMQVVSQSMNKYPAIKLSKINWLSDTNPEASLDQRSASSRPAQGFVATANTGMPAAPGFDAYQIAEVKGSIEPFDGNYREAINLINTFVESMRKSKDVHDIDVISLPLDLSSTTSIQGNSQARSGSAEFSMRIVVGLNHDG